MKDSAKIQQKNDIRKNRLDWRYFFIKPIPLTLKIIVFCSIVVQVSSCPNLNVDAMYYRYVLHGLLMV